RPACQLRTRCGGRRGELAAPHMREVHAAALEEIAVLDHAAYAAAPLRTLPRIAGEGFSVQRLQRRHDPGLQFTQVLEDLHFLFRARWPMSLRYCMPAKRIWSIVS